MRAAALNQAALRRKQYGSLVSCEFIAHQFVPKLTTRTRMPPTPLLAFPERRAFGAFAPGHEGNEGTRCARRRGREVPDFRHGKEREAFPTRPSRAQTRS